MGKERNYGIDILKIVSVIMIIVSHIVGYANFTDIVGFGTVKWYETYALTCLFIPFLNCFALITGYIMYEKKRNWTRFTALHTKVLIYSIVIMIIAVIFSNEYKFADVIYNFVPTLSSRYWYWTAYVIVFVFSPFINKLLDVLDKEGCKKLLFAIFFTGVILNIIKDGAIQGPGFMYGYSAIWLLFCYVIGAIIKKINLLKKFSSKDLIIVSVICFIITYLVTIGMEIAQYRIGGIITDDMKSILFKYDSITVITEAVCLIELFSRINISLNNRMIKKIILFFSNASFGVYILHNHYMIRERLMLLFTWVTEFSSILYVFGVLLVAMLIYTCCSLIDVIVDRMILKSKVIKKINYEVSNVFQKWLG